MRKNAIFYITGRYAVKVIAYITTDGKIVARKHDSSDPSMFHNVDYLKVEQRKYSDGYELVCAGKPHVSNKARNAILSALLDVMRANSMHDVNAINDTQQMIKLRSIILQAPPIID